MFVLKAAKKSVLVKKSQSWNATRHAQQSMSVKTTHERPASDELMSVQITHERPASDEYVQSSTSWPLWNSTTHEDGSGQFHFAYNGDYATERTYICTGSATLTPDDGSDPVHIRAGDAVWFHHGFSCKWAVHEPMTKRYQYFGADGAIKTPAAIACDDCGVDCEKESYLVGGEEDLCPGCYAKRGGTGGEHQRMGVAVVVEKVVVEKVVEEEVEARPKKKAKTT